MAVLTVGNRHERQGRKVGDGTAENADDADDTPTVRLPIVDEPAYNYETFTPEPEPEQRELVEV